MNFVGGGGIIPIKKWGAQMKKIIVEIWLYVKTRLWYFCLLICSSIFVYQNRANINQLKEFNSINLIFLLWIVLLLLPLFSEMEFFGVKFKRELEKSKNEISNLKEQIFNLKINNSLINSPSFSVYTSSPVPSESEVNKTLQSIEKDQEDSLLPEENIDEFASDTTIYLFKVRLTIEKILSGLCNKLIYQGPPNVSQMLAFASQTFQFKSQTVDYIKQINSICNKGIHGEIVSEKYIQLVKVLLPQVLSDLNAITSRMGYKYYFVCPKCNFSGYAEYENVCPQCGFASGD